MCGCSCGCFTAHSGQVPSGTFCNMVNPISFNFPILLAPSKPAAACGFHHSVSLTKSKIFISFSRSFSYCSRALWQRPQRSAKIFSSLSTVPAILAPSARQPWTLAEMGRCNGSLPGGSQDALDRTTAKTRDFHKIKTPVPRALDFPVRPMTWGLVHRVSPSLKAVPQDVRPRPAPTGAKKWLACPGSVQMEAGVMEKPSAYAEEGTAAHAPIL